MCSDFRWSRALYTFNAPFGTQGLLARAIGLCEILRVKLEFAQFDMGAL